MAIEITIPELGRAHKSAKELIISALVYEYPLTLATLTNVLKRKFQAKVTFQGVRKAVNLLVENGVVIKTGKEYSLSKDWILQLRDFVENLHESYFTKSKKIRNIEAIGEDIKVYTFDNIIDLDVFWNSLIVKWFDEDKHNSNEKYYVQQAGHTWYVLANLEEETRILDKIEKYNIRFFTLASGSTVLDRWCQKYYENHNFFYATSKNNVDTSRYFAVYNDYIIQCNYPEELNTEIDRVYRSAKDFESFDVTTLIKLLRKKIELKVTVLRNPVIAEQLREGILSHFKRNVRK